MLVRIAKSDPGKPAWLLIKARDDHATASTLDASVADDAPNGATMPRRIEPQLATPVANAPTQGRWYVEIKLDGYRLLARCRGTEISLRSRNGLDWTTKLPQIVTALARLKLQDTWLDGELIAPDARGQPQFELLQQRLDKDDDAALSFHVFDLLYADGVDLRVRPLRERRPLLQRALAGVRASDPLRLVDYVEGGTSALLEQACRERLEGLILKDVEAPYRSGRNRGWLKLKCRREEEFVIGGYTRTAAGRGTLTALLLGQRGDTSRVLRFAGRAGTGFSATALADLRRRLDRLAQDKCPFDPQPRLRSGERPTWVKPQLVAQVRHAGWTMAGLLRQPIFVGLRADKDARSVRGAPDRWPARGNAARAR
jgi:bifunctional non-homologous end joining protein LigD